MEDTVLEPAPCEFDKEALDGIEPRTRGWREVESPAWMTVEPGADLVLLVRRVIVEDHVDGLVRRHLALDAAGVSLTQALAEFVQLAASPDPDTCARSAPPSRGKPLSSIMPSTQVDEYGKVLAKSPGFLGDESDTDLALYHLIVRNEALRR